MDPRIEFRRMPPLEGGGAAQPPEVFHERFAAEVQTRFKKLTGIAVVSIPVHLADRGPLDPAAVHPRCRPFAQSAYCRVARRDHLDRLRRSPEIVWHHCPQGLLCAMVPLCHQGCCLAACQLVCPDRVGASRFETLVQLLEMLVDHFAQRRAGLLAGLVDPAGGEVGASGPRGQAPSVVAGAHHPRVLATLDYIQRHLTDPQLSVGLIAAAQDVNPSYLAHLFASETGVRMSHYIACRRIRLAKKLLRGTAWQVKRVALSCGYAHADWFSEVFHVHCGVTPSQFRRVGKSAAAPAMIPRRL